MIDSPLALVGLGNPGLLYEATRHNVGRVCLSAIAQAHHVGFQKFKKFGYVAWLKHGPRQVALFYPDGYMNHSGYGVGEFMHYYRIPPSNLCVLHDELERKVGICHLKLGGSARGHNGLKHIIEVLGDSFWRLGIGIDHPKKRGLPNSVSDFVLSCADEQDQRLLDESVSMLVQLSEHLFMGEFEVLKLILEGRNKKSR